MEDLVGVLYVTFVLPVAGANGRPLRETYEIREHEGDVFKTEAGGFVIQYAPRDVQVGVEKKRVAGKHVMVSATQLVAVEREVKHEPRVRQSVKARLNREEAELEALRKKMGLE